MSIINRRFTCMSQVNMRIASIRKTLNMNQKEFSSRLKMTQSNLSRIELGKQEASITLLESIIDEFRINPTWLLTGQGSMFFDSVQNGQNQNEATETGKTDSAQNGRNRNEPSGEEESTPSAPGLEPRVFDSVQIGPNQNEESEKPSRPPEEMAKEIFEDISDPLTQMRIILDTMERRGETDPCPVCSTMKKLNPQRRLKVTYYAEGLLHEQMMEDEAKTNRNVG